MTRYTLYLTQPDGSYRVHVTGDGPEADTDTPALPGALLTALGELYGDGWVLVPMWFAGWCVYRGAEAMSVLVGYIDTGPTPAEPDPRQADLLG